MKSVKTPSWLYVSALTFFSLITLTCNGTPTPSASQQCHGDLFVERSVVARVTPQPKETYQVSQTYTWDAPFGIEVTGNGKGILQVFDALNKLLSKFNVYAATSTSGDVTVKEWNGLKTITFNAGNFYIQDNGGQNQCKLNLLADGVSITSTGTEYVITVRPDIEEVTVGVLDGAMSVTSRDVTVTLDAQVPDEQLVVVSNGIIGPLQPIPDPGRLLEDVISGGDILPEIPEVPDSLTLWAEGQLLPVLEEYGAQFEMDTGVEVLIEGVPLEDILDRYLIALEAGNPPDLLTVSNGVLLGLVESELLLPVDPGIDPDLFVPGVIQAFSVNGVYYGVPYVYINLALVSNPAYLQSIPPTWSELSALTAELAFGREFFTGLMIPADGLYFYPVQSAFGGYVFGTNPDGSYNTQDIGMDNRGSLAAAAWLEEFVNTQPVFQGDEEAAIRFFQGGNAAIIITGPWSLPRLREAGINYRIDPFPREAQDSQPLLDMDAFVISSASQSPEYSRRLILEYLTRPEALLAYSGILGLPPAHIDVLKRIEDLDVRAFGIAGMNGVPIPNIPEMQVVWDPWNEAIQAITAGELSAEEAFIGAANQIRQSLDQ